MCTTGLYYLTRLFHLRRPQWMFVAEKLQSGRILLPPSSSPTLALPLC